jgi:hypothetical protein
MIMANSKKNYKGETKDSNKKGKWKKEQERNHKNFKSMIFVWMSCTYTYEIAEKFPKEHFEGNMTMSTIITLWECCSQGVRPLPLSPLAVTSCHAYPLSSSAPNGGCR